VIGFAIFALIMGIIWVIISIPDIYEHVTGCPWELRKEKTSLANEKLGLALGEEKK
jgi:hypothetical protein